MKTAYFIGGPWDGSIVQFKNNPPFEIFLSGSFDLAKQIKPDDINPNIFLNGNSIYLYIQERKKMFEDEKMIYYKFLERFVNMLEILPVIEVKKILDKYPKKKGGNHDLDQNV